jgi:eukaryotic-like serine/threonine-protein kinase
MPCCFRDSLPNPQLHPLRFQCAFPGEGSAVTESHVLPPRYRDPERVARGGMGEVYRAEDSVLGRTVAIKVLAEHYADDEGIRRRFTREALAAARLSNAPSTVTIFDVGEHAGRPYIVMEYLPGGSLADLIAAEGAQPPGRALAWLAQTAAALDAAHSRGIIHRDVKPANLLLDDENQVHVADFGVASAVGLDSFTAAGTVLGTAGYLAPEQARGEPTSPAVDRYALAVVAFELLTGSRPYQSSSPTAEAAAHVNAPVPSAAALNPELPREIDDVLRQGLAKDPDARFPSAAELVAALREALDAAAGRTVISRAAVPAPPPARRRRLPIALAGLVTLLLGGVALAAAVTNDGDRPTTEATPTTVPLTVPLTVRETVTQEGTTVVKTVTTEVEPPPTTAPPATTEEAEETQPTAQPRGDPVALNDQGYALMRAGDYSGALPLLEQSVAGLAGSGNLTEAYASYNLAFTRRALGSCDGVLELLERSEEVQGRRKEIDRLRRDAERACDD